MASHDVEQAANEIIREIWDDLTDRQCIKHELTGCDKREIRNVWRKAIEPRLAAAESDLARVTADNERLVAELYLREDPSAKIAEVCKERDRVTAELASRQMQCARAVGTVYEADGMSDHPADWDTIVEHIGRSERDAGAVSDRIAELLNDRDSWKERAERAERARDAASCAWGEAAKRGAEHGTR